MSVNPFDPMYERAKRLGIRAIHGWLSTTFVRRGIAVSKESAGNVGPWLRGFCAALDAFEEQLDQVYHEAKVREELAGGKP